MAKTVDNFATIEDFRTTYNELAYDVGDVSGLRAGLKTGNNGTIVDAVNVLEDKQFFFQEFVFVASTNQTLFTGNDEFVNNLVFVKDKIQVFKNERHLIEDVDFIISNPTGTGSHEGITLTGTYASGQANAMSTNDRLHVYSYTGAFVGTNIANSVASFFQKTVENTIYNTNANGVIINGDSSSPTTLLESGYTIQLAGKTFAEDDILLTTGKTLTAPTITDSTMSINSGSITGAVNGTFSGFLDIEGNIDVNGTSNLDVVDIDGAVDMASTLTVDGNTDLNSNLTVDGNTTLGNAASDTITFTGYANSHLRPETTNTYSLGLTSKRWSNVFSNSSNVSGTATVGTLTDGTLSITGGDITSVDDITGDTNSVFKSGSAVVNNIKDFDGTHTILDTTSDHNSNANAGSLTGTVSSLANHTTQNLTEHSSNLYYTNARADARIALKNIDYLANVTNSSLANDDVLLYNGTAWVNTPMQERVEDIAGAMLSGNTETGLSVTYNDTTGKTNLVVDNSTFTLTGGVTGTATQTAKGNLTIATTLRDLTKTDITDTQLALNDLYDVSDANNTADQILVQDANGDWSNVTLTEKVQDIAGGMFTSSNTETGVSVSYNDNTNDIDVVVDNSDFALTGKVTGTATQTAKGDVSIATSVNLALSDLPSIDLEDLANVNSGASTGQVLVWSGSAWNPADQAGSTSNLTEDASAVFFTDNRVAKQFKFNASSDGTIAQNGTANVELNKGIKLTYNDNPDGGTNTTTDGEITLEASVSNGIALDGNDIELDYSVITDSDLSSGLPSGSGKEIGHLFFLI